MNASKVTWSKRSALLLGAAALTLGFQTPSFAAPAISGVAGSVAQNQSITITGGSFGTHADYHTDEPNQLNFSWQDFSGGLQSKGYGWTSSAAANQWQYMTSGGRSTNNAFARRINSSSQNDNVSGLQKPGSGTVPASGKYFISHWFRAPSTTMSGKTIRFAGNTFNGGDDFWMATGGTGTALRASNDASVQWGGPSAVADGTWKRIDLWLDAASPLQESWVIGANNNNPQWTMNWNITGTGGLSNAFQVNVGAGKDSGGTTSSNYYDYDDLYIDFTQARVEICDTNSWTARSHCEIQIPQAWSSTSVTAKVNQGSFSASSVAYLYVVDASGTVSNPYAVTFGSSTASTTPAAPTGLMVKAVQ